MSAPPVISLGVDPAKTALAAVAVHPSGFEVFTRTMPQDITECCLKAFLWMQRVIREERQMHPGWPVRVFIEKALAGKGINATIVQAYVQGALIAGAKSVVAEVIQVNQATWKLRVVGKGNAGKPDVAAHIEAEWPLLYDRAKPLSGGKPDQNVLDAGSIAWYGDLFNQSTYAAKIRRRSARR